ncbi:MAG: DUF1902 domain-containing protein [Thermoanaerobaculia bacterium]
MQPIRYHVEAVWDPEASVWVATSEDVPGLATEADTIEDLAERLRAMIPELLAANGLLPATIGAGPISFELTGHREELVTLVS